MFDNAYIVIVNTLCMFSISGTVPSYGTDAVAVAMTIVFIAQEDSDTNEV